MIVLRITPHPATQDQLEYLQQVYGQDVEIIEHDGSFETVSECYDLILSSAASVVELDLPLWMFKGAVLPAVNHLSYVRIILPKMALNCKTGNTEFGGYEIVKRSILETEPLLVLHRPVPASPATSHLH